MKTKPYPRCAVCNFSIIKSVATFLDGKNYHSRCHKNRDNKDFYTVSGHQIEIAHMDVVRDENIWRVGFVPIDSVDEKEEIHLFLGAKEAKELANKLLELSI